MRRRPRLALPSSRPHSTQSIGCDELYSYRHALTPWEASQRRSNSAGERYPNEECRRLWLYQASMKSNTAILASGRLLKTWRSKSSHSSWRRSSRPARCRSSRRGCPWRRPGQPRAAAGRSSGSCTDNPDPMMDDRARWPPLPHRHLQRLDHQRRVQARPHCLADDATAEDINDRGQVEPALPGPDVGDIGQPEPVRPARLECPPDQIGCRRGPPASAASSSGSDGGERPGCRADASAAAHACPSN